MQKTLPTKKVCLVIAVTSLLLFPQEAFSNPGSYGMQLCSMMRSGTSQSRAWNYIIEQHTMRTGGQMGGFGIAAGVIAGQQLRGMRSDVFAVARANCPEAFGGGSYRTSTSTPRRLLDQNNVEINDKYCLWNPWSERCTDGSYKRTQDRSNCFKALKNMTANTLNI